MYYVWMHNVSIQSYVFEWAHMCFKRMESVMKEYFSLDFPWFVLSCTFAFEAKWEKSKCEEQWVAASLSLPKAIAPGRWSSFDRICREETKQRNWDACLGGKSRLMIEEYLMRLIKCIQILRGSTRPCLSPHNPPTLTYTHAQTHAHT